MEYEEKSELFVDLEPVLDGLGYTLIEAAYTKLHARTQVRVVIARQELTTDDTSTVYRMLLPRLQMFFDNSNVGLEVSSPGINRVLKHRWEFALFAGKHMRVYAEDAWHEGVLVRADEEGVYLLLDGAEAADAEAERFFAFDAIHKAKLAE